MALFYIKYLRYEALNKPDNNTSVEEFWIANWLKFPVIYEIFKLYHGAPAFSTASERVFLALEIKFGIAEIKLHHKR